METFTSFKEWLISHEGIAPARAKVIASNLRFAQNCLGSTYVYEGKQNIISSLYSLLIDANRYSGDTLQEKLSVFLTASGKLYKYSIIEYDEIRTYGEKGISEKRLNEIKTAFIKYFQFLSCRFECLRLSDIQKKLQEYDSDSKVVKSLTKWDPNVKISKKQSNTAKFFSWLGWRFHNMGLSSIFRKFGASVFSQGDEEFVQIPMTQFHKFMEAYGELYKNGLLSDIYKGSSFIVDNSSDYTRILSFDDVMGSSLHLFGGSKELDFKSVKSMQVDVNTGNLIVDYENHQIISIQLPIISGRKPRYRKLSFRTTFDMPVGARAGLLSEIRNECAVIRDCLEEFCKVDICNRQTLYIAIEKVDTQRTIQAANNAYTLLRHFASLLRIDLVIE